MSRRVRLGLFLALALSAVATSAVAQEAGSIGEGPRVFSIKPRPFELGHEFQLGLGVLPMDAFYVGVVLSASYTYHFSDFWAWEIASVGYSLNFDTSLASDLYTDYHVRPVDNGGDRIHKFGTTSLVVKPLFGKFAVWNRSVISTETFFVVGVGGLELGSHMRTVGNVGLGLRFWSSEALSFRLDLRDYLVFTTYVPRQVLAITLSASFNVAGGSAHREEGRP